MIANARENGLQGQRSQPALQMIVCRLRFAW
jgi:hypothetical protein